MEGSAIAEREEDEISRRAGKRERKRGGREANLEKHVVAVLDPDLPGLEHSKTTLHEEHEDSSQKPPEDVIV